MIDAMIKMHPLGATAEPGTPIEEFEIWLQVLIEQHRAINWRIGDLVNAVQRQHQPVWEQALPLGVSPDMISRYKFVAGAYKLDDRNADANWTIHMQASKNPDRLAVVAAHVEAGHTSDEARKNPPPSTAVKTDWLLAVDVNYFVHSYFHSGAGVESASTFDAWLWRLIDRIAYKSPTNPQKGLTDVVCCLDARDNHRKKLTEGWEHPYKPRSEKDPVLSAQLNLAPELLKKRGLSCVVMDGMEADDVMASYAAQFPGKVTLLTEDKDLRQCLKPGKCNMLTNVTWELNEETGNHLPVYHFVSAQQHIDDGCKTYKATKGEVVKGITPEQWPHFQAIAGDSGDGIKGCIGIGGVGAMELIKAHGTVQGVIAAAKDGTVKLTDKKLAAVLEFDEVAEVMLKLTTLRTDLNVPMVTKLCLQETP